MRTQIIALALAAALQCEIASAQWVQTNGPHGGNVSCLAVSGSDLFAGTYGGGVFLSTNRGGNWTQVHTGLTNTDIYALAVSGTNLFAGTWGGGVFLSTNSGANWIQTGLTNTIVFAFAVSGTDLFAGTNYGVFPPPMAGGIGL